MSGRRISEAGQSDLGCLKRATGAQGSGGSRRSHQFHERAGDGRGAVPTARCVIGHQLDEHATLVQRSIGAQDAGERSMQHGEGFQDEIMPGTKVGALVLENRGQLVVGECVNRALRDDDAMVASSGDAIRHRSGLSEHPHRRAS